PGLRAGSLAPPGPGRSAAYPGDRDSPGPPEKGACRVRLRIRRRAKKELLDIDDDATFFGVGRAILDLAANPRARGYDKVEGREEIYRIWVGRDWRLLYSIDAHRAEVVIEAVRPKDEGTYRR